MNCWKGETRVINDDMEQDGWIELDVVLDC